MPELPEVETVRRTLCAELVGRRIVSQSVLEKRLRYAVEPSRLRRTTKDRTVTTVDRRGKYLLVRFDRKGCLLVHLGMSGTFVVADVNEPRLDHVHLIFGLDDGRELRYRDPRRFGFVDALRDAEIATDRRLALLGVEPLSSGFDVARVFRRRAACAGP